jgi:hypothetical protein
MSDINSDNTYMLWNEKLEEILKISCDIILESLHFSQATSRAYLSVTKLICEGVSISFWTGHLQRELQMIQLSATRYSCLAVL